MLLSAIARDGRGGISGVDVLARLVTQDLELAIRSQIGR